jgi:hypothetical protein
MLRFKHLFLAVGVFTLSAQAQVNTLTYTFTGGVQTFNIPNCVSQVTIECFGASGGTAVGNGGTAIGGLGGYAKGILNVVGGDVLSIYVGGQNNQHLGGFNGGGNAGTIINTTVTSLSRGGGGASDVRFNGTSLNDRVIVAGGGGGAGARGGQGTSSTPTLYLQGGNGGSGGGVAGGDGIDGLVCKGGKGGTLNTGGLVGVGCTNVNVLGTNGFVPNGGNVTGCCNNTNPSGGGGGGGYLPGGGGGAGGVGDPACNGNDEGGGGGGAGGSNYVGSLSATTTSVGVKSGNGEVIIRYTVNPITVNIVPTTTLVCAGESATLSATGAPNYTWSTGATTSSIVITPLAQTTYSVLGSSAVNCNSNASLVIGVTCIGLKEYNQDNNARVYPNPAKDKFVLEGDNLEYAQISMSNVEGRIIPVPVTRIKKGFEVDVKSLSSGAYFVLINRSGVTTVKKIMVD